MGKATWDHIPGTIALSALSKNYRKHWNDPIARNAALGRQGVGLLLGGAFATWAAQGNITGSLTGTDQTEPATSTDVGRKRMNEQLGDNAHSVYIPGYGWAKHDRLGVIGKLMSMSADGVRIANLVHEDDTETMELVAMTIGAAYGAIVMDPTYNKGIRDFTDLVMAPGDAKAGAKAELWLEKQAATAVPRIVNQGRMATDDIVREATDVLGQILNRLPGGSKDMPPKYDTLTGKPMNFGASPYAVFLDPTRRKQPPETVPHYVLEMYNLGMEAPRVPRRMGTYNGVSMDSPVELPLLMQNDIAKRAHTIELSGITLQGALNDVVTDPRFKEAPRNVREAKIHDLFSTFFEQARNELIESVAYPEFNSAVNKSAAKSAKRNARP
jgi:hypothetical protein